MHVGVPHCTGQDTTKCAPGSSQLHGLAGIAQQFCLDKNTQTLLDEVYQNVAGIAQQFCLDKNT